MLDKIKAREASKQRSEKACDQTQHTLQGRSPESERGRSGCPFMFGQGSIGGKATGQWGERQAIRLDG